MKCPLLEAACIINPDDISTSAGECIKEECQWWNTAIPKCCVPVLADRVDRLVVALMHIKDKMPVQKKYERTKAHKD